MFFFNLIIKQIKFFLEDKFFFFRFLEWDSKMGYINFNNITVTDDNIYFFYNHRLFFTEYRGYLSDSNNLNVIKNINIYKNSFFSLDYFNLYFFFNTDIEFNRNIYFLEYFFKKDIFTVFIFFFCHIKELILNSYFFSQIYSLDNYFFLFYYFFYSFYLDSYYFYISFYFFFILVYKLILLIKLIYIFLLCLFIFFYTFLPLKIFIISFFSLCFFFFFFFYTYLFTIIKFFSLFLQILYIILLTFYQGFDFYFYFTFFFLFLYPLIYPIYDLKALLPKNLIPLILKYYTFLIPFFYFCSLWLILDYYFLSNCQQFLFIDNLQFYSIFGDFLNAMQMPYYWLRPFFFIFLFLWPVFLGQWFLFKIQKFLKHEIPYNHVFFLTFRWPLPNADLKYFRKFQDSDYFLLTFPFLPLKFSYSIKYKSYFWIYPEVVINYPTSIKKFSILPFKLQFEWLPLTLKIPYLTKNILIYNPFFKKAINKKYSYFFYYLVNSIYNRSFMFINFYWYNGIIFKTLNSYTYLCVFFSFSKFLYYFFIKSLQPIVSVLYVYLYSLKKPFYDNLVLLDYFYTGVYGETIFTKMEFIKKYRKPFFKIIKSENFNLGREEIFGDNYIDNIFNPELAALLQNMSGDLFDDITLEEGYNLWSFFFFNWQETISIFDILRANFEYYSNSYDYLFRIFKKMRIVRREYPKSVRKQMKNVLLEIDEMHEEHLEMFYEEWYEEVLEQMDLMTPELHETFLEIFINYWLLFIMIFLSFFYYNIIFFLYFFLNFFTPPLLYLVIVYLCFALPWSYFYFWFNITFWTSRIKMFLSIWDLLLYDIILLIRDWQTPDEEWELRAKYTEDEWFVFFNNEMKDELKHFTYKFRYTKFYNFWKRYKKRKIKKKL